MRTPFPTGAPRDQLGTPGGENLGRGVAAQWGPPPGATGVRFRCSQVVQGFVAGRDALHLNLGSCTGRWGPLVCSRRNRGSKRAVNDRCMPPIGRFITETVCTTVSQLCYGMTKS
ncbi:hypothetical protein GCM10010502_09370 [Kitasatospora aureofaciens]|uniref:Uncharacterized protein n=1 Tax=Kitasatospora aureofaciens TaxID=1894 RepID=A0A8H9HG01_KITAU|nr:hypothetical protein GCM10010502_09370 [Kitasatospora aureofaciens]